MDRRASKCFKFQHYETDLTGALYDHHRRQKLQLFLVIQVNIHSHLQITLAHRKGLSVATVWYRPSSLPAQGCSLVHCRPTLCYELWLLYCCLDLQCKSTPSSLTSVDLPATLACTANKSFFFFFFKFSDRKNRCGFERKKSSRTKSWQTQCQHFHLCYSPKGKGGVLSHETEQCLLQAGQWSVVICISMTAERLTELSFRYIINSYTFLIRIWCLDIGLNVISKIWEVSIARYSHMGDN